MFGILVFGDSIVHGRGEQPNIGWVGRLKNYFEKQDPFYALYNVGIPGDTTSGLLERFDIEAKARIHYYYQGDKFIVMFGIGTNDALCIENPEKHNVEPSKFKENILALIEKAKTHTKYVVFVGLLPVNEDKTNPFEKTYLTNQRQKEYNNITKECCKQENIDFIDLIDDWLKKDYKKLLEDGLHPNSKGYDEIYRSIKEFLVKKELMK